MTKITEGFTVIDGKVVPITNIKEFFTTREEAERSIRPRDFEIGKKYQWVPGKAWPSQGLRHGPLTCIHVGAYQGGFTSERGDDAGLLENRSGLHIVATGHLRSGDIIKLPD